MENDKVGDYKKTEEYYNQYGTWYDIERQKGYYELINKREIEIVRKFGVNKDLLEIGCGTGIILEETKKFARSACGVDLSPGMLERAREKGLAVGLANAAELPFSDKSFDMVYSFKVLAHIPEIEKTVLEAARVTRDGGLMILEFYNSYSFKRITNVAYNFFKKRGVYIRYDSLGKIKKYLPENCKIIAYSGIKVLALGKKLLEKPFFSKLEKKLATSFWGRFGGYLVVIIRKNAAK